MTTAIGNRNSLFRLIVRQKDFFKVHVLYVLWRPVVYPPNADENHIFKIKITFCCHLTHWSWLPITIHLFNRGLTLVYLVLFFLRNDGREYALKQIEGTGISMSACREIAVSSAGTASTIRCHDKVVQYNMMLDIALQWLRQDINQSPHKTPLISPSQASYCEDLGENFTWYKDTTMCLEILSYPGEQPGWWFWGIIIILEISSDIHGTRNEANISTDFYIVIVVEVAVFDINVQLLNKWNEIKCSSQTIPAFMELTVFPSQWKLVWYMRKHVHN